MLFENSNFFDDYGNLIWWKVPIDTKYINFAIRILKRYDVKNNSLKNFINEQEENKLYQLNKIYLKNASDNALFYYKENTRISHTNYPFMFNIPRKCITEDTMNKLHEEGSITINKWAYENCFKRSINYILEQWGKMIYGLLQLDLDSPIVKYSPYYKLLKKMNEDVEKGKKNFQDTKSGSTKVDDKKDVSTENIQTEKRNDIQFSNKAHANRKNDGTEKKMEEKEPTWIFMTDGSGNLYENKKVNPTGHYHVLLTNTDEKWRKEEDLTSNQAELKGVIAAIQIAIKRNYQNVLIQTDSKNVVNWFTGRWKGKGENIKHLTKILLVMKKQLLDLQVKWIPRQKNKAHKFK